MSKHKHARANLWVSGQEVPVTAELSNFEKLVNKLNLKPAQYEGSDELKQWVLLNKNERYVPEWLLESWHIVVEGCDEYSAIHFSRAAMREAQQCP